MINVKLIRKIAIYAFFIVFLLTLGLYVYGSKAEESYPEFSTYSVKPDGTKAVFLLSEQMGFNVSRHERPTRFLADNVTLVAVKPDISIFNDELERKYLGEWLKRGNTLVLVDDISNVSKLKLEGFGAKITEGKDLGGTVSVYEVSKGKLCFIDGTGRFTNRGLKDINPAVEFISVLDYAGNKRVVFDEYFHGMGARGITFFDLLGINGMLVLVQLLLALVLYLYVKSRRFGKSEVVFEIIKRQENENLFALSNLYVKSKAYSVVLKTYLSFFNKRLLKFLGFSQTPDDRELHAAIYGNSFLEKRNLRNVLIECNRYIDLDRKDGKQLFHLINSLERIRKEIG